EKVDLVQYRDDQKQFIAEALSPVRGVREVRIDEEEKEAIVIVPDGQLSLAIGKEGQNARLAARLTGYRIDIRPESNPEGLPIEEPEADVEVEVPVEAEAPAEADIDVDVEVEVPAEAEVEAEAEAEPEVEVDVDAEAPAEAEAESEPEAEVDVEVEVEVDEVAEVEAEEGEVRE
ncbi:MAG: KH domain-containing protein, partial [Acidimicrobiia bacterium]|nr:KH domain-containing protein [Acidimicrobiia bacterium]